MALLLLFGTVVLFPRAAALSSKEEWSDFADNFATDLAPLIALFGEQVTKQFLSESIGVLDNIIFGLAPLGILTAVVSVIRLYGRASLKSFIGRAQEAHGVAEAELCSSTSHDVCELWSNGGICRVFGRPKILEFIYTKEAENYYPITASRPGAQDDEPPQCGIYLPKDVMSRRRIPVSSPYRWSDVSLSRRIRRNRRDRRVWRIGFAPFPNLSLNVGTRRTSKRVLLVATATGLLLETSFFVYATWATFYNSSFYDEDSTPQIWSFVLCVAGTLFLMCGMSLCAVVVDRRSTERRFTAAHKPDGSGPYIHWLQCGNQRIGDQQFNSFAYSEKKKEYITSFIDQPDSDPIFGLQPRIVLWAAIVPSLLGFACQFVGFRGLHGSIVLYRLACTLAMSIIRALLRSRRLGREHNCLEGVRRLSNSDELDWQALDIVSNDYPMNIEYRFASLPLTDRKPHQYFFDLTNSQLDTGLIYSPLSKKARSLVASSKVDILLSRGDIGSGVVGFRFAGVLEGAPRYTERNMEAYCVDDAVKFIQLLEGDIRHDDLVFKPLEIWGEQKVPDFDLNPVARIVNIRARLGYLTGDQSQPAGMQWDPELQATARMLQKALGEALGYIFCKAPLRSGWEGAKALVWSTVGKCKVWNTRLSTFSLPFPLHFLSVKKGQQWIINEYQLAAIIGLYRNSILHHCDGRYEKRKIMQAMGSSRRTAAIIRLWIAKEGALEQITSKRNPPESASLLPLRLSLRYLDRDYEDEPDGSESPNSALVSVLALPTSGTLLNLIAQDIFTIFMFEIASIIESLTEVSVRQPVGSSPGNTTSQNPNITSSTLSNTHIDALAGILCEAGLATEESALMCIVPALFHHGKLPSLDDSVDRLLDDARKLRTDQQYEKGAAALQSLLKICAHEQQERVLRALGELFRHAIRSPNAVHRDFGFQAMKSLKEDMVYEGAPTLSPAAMVVLHDYGSLAESLYDRSGRRGGSWNSKSPPDLEISPVLELHKELDQPPKSRSRLTALLILEKYDITGRNNSAICELLFVAIALGQVEVLEDLRALNDDLIFELPSRVALPGNPPCSSASIWAKFDADNLAQADGQVRPDSTIGLLATAWAASQLEYQERVPGEAEAVLRMMLDWASVNEDFTDGYINTLLSYAVNSGNTKTVDILLEEGAIIDDQTDVGEALLATALRPFWDKDAGDTQPDTALVSLLLKHGAPVGHHLADIVEAATENLAADWIRHLHAWGYDVIESSILNRGFAGVIEMDEPNERDLDPDLLYAPKKRHQTDALIRLLFDLELPLQLGDVHLAVRLRPSDGILAMVLGNGTFDLDTIWEDRGTPLQMLLNYDLWDGPATERKSFLDMMLRAGCDPNLDSPDWKATPLQIACSCSDVSVRDLENTEETTFKYKHTETVALPLIRLGANVNLTAADIPGEGRRLIRSTPLELACLTAKGDIVKALIKAGANVNTPGGEFGPPLQAACYQFGQRWNDDGPSDFIVLGLIRAGADLNAVAEPGGTALAVATHSLQSEKVALLLSSGADPHLHTLPKPSTSLFPELFPIFRDMQTGIFERRTWTCDVEKARSEANMIVSLFAMSGVVISPEALLHPEDH